MPRGRGGGRRWGDNGFEAWGGYMAAKKAKLEEQFSDDVKRRNSGPAEGSTANASPAGIFHGVAIFVNGYTDPSGDDLKRIMMMNGGTFHHYFNSRKTTHIIATNLPDSKVKALKGDEPICHPNWIVESLEAKKLLDYRKYLLYTCESKTQPKLKFKVGPQVTSATSSNEQRATPTPASDSRSGPALDASDSRFLGEFYSNSRLHHISTMGAGFKQYVNELRDASDGFFPGRAALEEWAAARPELATAAAKGQTIMHIDMDCFFVSVGLRRRPDLVGKPVAVAHARGTKEASASDVATRKAEMDLYRSRRNRNRDADKEDMDAETDDSKTENSTGPSLSKADFVEFSSMSELASVSYEARARGVKNGMFLGAARQLCPDLVTIPYDFDGYREVATSLYDSVASLTLDIQAVSCDEMLADVTEVLSAAAVSPAHLAQFLRQRIFEETGCRASVGMGSSILLARVATRRAKPDGWFLLADDSAEETMRAVGVSELPGVGRVNARRLREMKIETCEQMQALPLHELQREFGNKIGKSLHGFCRGLDDRKMNLRQERKSVSAEVNYGIRFNVEGDFAAFLDRLAAEVGDRLAKAGCHGGGRCITLKLMVRAKDAPQQTSKFLGHGVCDSLSRSATLSFPTKDTDVIAREAKLLARAMGVQCQDLRGIGIQMSKLDFGSSEGSRSKSILTFVKRGQADKSDLNERSVTNATAASSSSIVASPQPDDLSFSQLDPDVLGALPDDLRAEVEETCRARRSARLTSRGDGPRQEGESSGSLLDATISQLDPDYLSALPPEMADEVRQQLADAKKGSNARPVAAQNAFQAIMSTATPTKREATPTRARRRGRPPKNSPRFVKSSARSKANKQLFGDSPAKCIEKKVLAQSNDSELQQTSPEASIEGKNKDDDEEKVEESANLDGESDLDGVRGLLKQWMRSCPAGPTADDFGTVAAYFRAVVRQRERLHILPPLLRLMDRVTRQLGGEWRDAFDKIVATVQTQMRQTIGYKLEFEAFS